MIQILINGIATVPKHGLGTEYNMDGYIFLTHFSEPLILIFYCIWVWCGPRFNFVCPFFASICLWLCQRQQCTYTLLVVYLGCLVSVSPFHSMLWSISLWFVYPKSKFYSSNHCYQICLSSPVRIDHTTGLIIARENGNFPVIANLQTLLYNAFNGKLIS